ncbi:hypothetical protein [Streptomyces mirabilis]|uniref:hypothetical protein n=1 Tax=Streptomyces mirabilis TaxID=68239 RepID=UPI0036C328C8
MIGFHSVRQPTAPDRRGFDGGKQSDHRQQQADAVGLLLALVCADDSQVERMPDPHHAAAVLTLERQR